MITDKLSRVAPDGLIGRLLRLPLRLVPKHAVVNVRSGLNKGMKWVVGSSIHGCWLGHYESEKQDLVRRLVKPGMKILDIGANAGFYTLAFSRLVGDSGHVFAFEPFAENVASLLRHVEVNNISNVTVIQTAVADEPGVTGFRIAASNSMGSISEAQKDYLVPTVTLDGLLDAGTLPVPDLIKMDVEGAESRVLDGAARMLARQHTSLLIALHGQEQMHRCFSFLHTVGYRIHRLDGQPISEGDGYIDEIYAAPEP